MALGYPLAGAVPLARKVVQALAAASFARPKRMTIVIERSQAPIQNPKTRSARPFVSMREGPATKKSRAGIVDPGTAPVCEIYSSWLYRVSCFVSLIISVEVDPFNSETVLTTFRQRVA